MNFLIEKVEHAVVVGGGRGIGFALIESLLCSYPSLKVYASYREPQRSLDLIALSKKFEGRLSIVEIDPSVEEDIQCLVDKIKLETTTVQMLLNVVGVLHDENVFPERKLSEVKFESLEYYFKINSSITLVLAKHFQQLFKHDQPSCFSTLSAKVGSLEDNRLGGWYGYRASKSALNMFLKNIAIEYNRGKGRCLVAAVHPGTTKTELSKPFKISRDYILHTAEQSAQNILGVLDGSEISDSAHFYSWDKSKIPW